MEQVTTIPQQLQVPGANRYAADRCFHCGRNLYGLQTIGAPRVCRSDCLGAYAAGANERYEHP